MYASIAWLTISAMGNLRGNRGTVRKIVVSKRSSQVVSGGLIPVGRWGAFEAGRLLLKLHRGQLQPRRLLLQPGGPELHVRRPRPQLRGLRAFLQLFVGRGRGRCHRHPHGITSCRLNVSRELKPGIAETVGRIFPCCCFPRGVKVYVEAYGCTQNYCEARRLHSRGARGRPPRNACVMFPSNPLSRFIDCIGAAPWGSGQACEPLVPRAARGGELATPVRIWPGLFLLMLP